MFASPRHERENQFLAFKKQAQFAYDQQSSDDSDEEDHTLNNQMSVLKGKGAFPNFELYACSKDTAGSTNQFFSSVNSQMDGPLTHGKADFLDEEFGLDDLEVMLEDSHTKECERDVFTFVKEREAAKPFNAFEKFDSFFTKQPLTYDTHLESSDDEDIDLHVPQKRESSGVTNGKTFELKATFGYAPSRVRERSFDANCRSAAPQRRRERSVSCSDSESD